MEVQINWLAVVLATLVSMVVGYVWYAPFGFGKAWQKLARIKDGSNDKSLPWIMLRALVLGFVTAYVLNHVIQLSYAYFQLSYMQTALTTAFWMWLGFQATLIFIHDGYEGRSLKLSSINAGYQFVTLMGMGLVFGFLLK